MSAQEARSRQKEKDSDLIFNSVIIGAVFAIFCLGLAIIYIVFVSLL